MSPIWPATVWPAMEISWYSRSCSTANRTLTSATRWRTTWPSPWPATTAEPVLDGSALGVVPRKQPPQAGLVDHGYSEAFSISELGAGALSGHHVGGLAGDRAGDLASGGHE